MVGNETRCRKSNKMAVTRNHNFTQLTSNNISIPVIFPNSKFSGDLEINRVEEDNKQTVGYGRYI